MSTVTTTFVPHDNGGSVWIYHGAHGDLNLFYVSTTVVESYDEYGFALYRTYDTWQWLPRHQQWQQSHRWHSSGG